MPPPPTSSQSAPAPEPAVVPASEPPSTTAESIPVAETLPSVNGEHKEDAHDPVASESTEAAPKPESTEAPAVSSAEAIVSETSPESSAGSEPETITVLDPLPTPLEDNKSNAEAVPLVSQPDEEAGSAPSSVAAAEPPPYEPQGRAHSLHTLHSRASDAKQEVLVGEDGEVYIGHATWEERTWKELVRLREDMFLARIGALR